MLSNLTTELLLAAGLEPAGVEQIVRIALDEDLRYGPDVTSAATAKSRCSSFNSVSFCLMSTPTSTKRSRSIPAT